MDMFARHCRKAKQLCLQHEAHIRKAWNAKTQSIDSKLHSRLVTLASGVDLITARNSTKKQLWQDVSKFLKLYLPKKFITKTHNLKRKTTLSPSTQRSAMLLLESSPETTPTDDKSVNKKRQSTSKTRFDEDTSSEGDESTQQSTDEDTSAGTQDLTREKCSTKRKLFSNKNDSISTDVLVNMTSTPKTPSDKDNSSEGDESIQQLTDDDTSAGTQDLRREKCSKKRKLFSNENDSIRTDVLANMTSIPKTRSDKDTSSNGDESIQQSTDGDTSAKTQDLWREKCSKKRKLFSNKNGSISTDVLANMPSTNDRGDSPSSGISSSLAKISPLTSNDCSRQRPRSSKIVQIHSSADGQHAIKSNSDKPLSKRVPTMSNVRVKGKIHTDEKNIPSNTHETSLSDRDSNTEASGTGKINTHSPVDGQNATDSDTHATDRDKQAPLPRSIESTSSFRVEIMKQPPEMENINKKSDVTSVADDNTPKEPGTSSAAEKKNSTENKDNSIEKWYYYVQYNKNQYYPVEHVQERVKGHNNIIYPTGIKAMVPKHHLQKFNFNLPANARFRVKHGNNYKVMTVINSKRTDNGIFYECHGLKDQTIQTVSWKNITFTKNHLQSINQFNESEM